MRRYFLTSRSLPSILHESRQYCRNLARDFQKITNNSFLAIEILNDENNWANAYTISVNGLLSVILPVKDLHLTLYRNSAHCPFSHNKRNILISVDHTGKIKTEAVLILPDGPMSLTGNILPDPCFQNSLERPLCATLFAEEVIPKIYQNAIVQPEAKPDPDAIAGINSGNDKIRNIKDYLKCFDNNPSTDHIYELMVCVMQPEPGTRKPWGMGDKHSGNPVDVGHTFLVATEKTPSKTVVRNVGFYPSSFVWPYRPSAQGMLNNDSYHDFNIAVIFTTTSNIFTQVLNYLSKGTNPGYQYNLNSNNCTTFVLDAMREGDIILPRTIGTWVNGKGLNPGDLGEDLRGLKLSSTMKRLTEDQSHPNQGYCV